MSEFLILLLMQVTIFSSVTALIIIAVKQIFRCRIPPRIGAVLWLVLLARLVCPIFPESEFSIYNLIPAGRTIVYTLQNDIAEEWEDRENERVTGENPYILRKTSENIQDSNAADSESESDGEELTIDAYIDDMIDETTTEDTEQFNRIILLVYASGIVMTMSVSAWCYIRARRRVIQSSLLCEDEMLLRCYRQTALKMHIRPEKTPPLRMGYTDMVAGCLNPTVVCRENLDYREAPMVFAHELSHYKYGDNPILLFSTFVTCLFWYNPLIWLVRSILREDLEVLCDVRTLTECGIPRTDYAMMLCRQSAFDVLHSDAIHAGCRMSAAGRHLKNRLRTISKSGKERYPAKACSVLLCTVIVMLCLTNPIVSQNDDYAAYIDNYAALTGQNERRMHLEEDVTVSTYLEQLSRILADMGLSDRIGGGNLERFRRLCAGSGKIDRDLLAELRELRTTEPLTTKNLTLISKCAAMLLEYDSGGREMPDQLLPGVLTAAEMNVMTANLTAAEREALLDCYNKGVAGAKVKFDYVYTEAMMNLILSRIDDPWIHEKFSVFYQRIDLSDGTGDFSSRLAEMVKGAGKRASLYVCDPNITHVEIEMLQEMIGAAEAGMCEDVYYLKGYEDLHEYKLTAWLIARSGYTADRMVRTYAEAGYMPYRYLTEENCMVLTAVEMNEILARLSPAQASVFERAYESVKVARTGEYSVTYETAEWRLRKGASVQSVLDVLNRVKFTQIRDSDGVTAVGVTEKCLECAAVELYTLGLLDAYDGVIDMTEQLSCGQSLCAAYRFACAIDNVK